MVEYIPNLGLGGMGMQRDILHTSTKTENIGESNFYAILGKCGHSTGLISYQLKESDSQVLNLLVYLSPGPMDPLMVMFVGE